MVDLGKAAWGGPCRAGSAVWVAVVKGRANCPDVLPLGRYMLRAGEGDRGWGGVFLEEPGVGMEIAILVWSGEEGLL